MRLLTYLFAAALLWAVAASGPSSSVPGPAPAAHADAPPAPQISRGAYPR
jgi:hypothetical protein